MAATRVACELARGSSTPQTIHSPGHWQELTDKLGNGLVGEQGRDHGDRASAPVAASVASCSRSTAAACGLWATSRIHSCSRRTTWKRPVGLERSSTGLSRAGVRAEPATADKRGQRERGVPELGG